MPAFGLAYLFGEDQLFTIYEPREYEAAEYWRYEFGAELD